MLAQATIWKIIAVITFVVNGTPMEERNPHPLNFETQADCAHYTATEKFKGELAGLMAVERKEHGTDTKITWTCQEGRLLDEDDDQPEERGA